MSNDPPTSSSGTRLAVVLFSDIVGSTELKSRLGDVLYKKLLDRHNELFESAIGAFPDATIIKHIGDGLLAQFRTPSDAVRFALDFQKRMHDEPWVPAKLQTRIGIHQGEITETVQMGRPDIVGAAVDATSRIMSIARGGQILLTQQAFNDARQYVRQLPDAPAPRLSDFGIGMLGDRSSLRAHAITETGFTQLTQSDSSRTGTRMYAPPESLLNRPFTTQGDVYALGVLLYQMAVADLSRPLGSGWERNIDDPILREDISQAVDGDPSRRLGSAAELAQRIRTLDQRREARRRDEEQAQRTLARARTRRIAMIASVGTMLIAVVAVFAFLRERRQTHEQARLRALAETLQQSESQQRQKAQVNLDRSRKEIADMVDLLEGKSLSGAAATQPTGDGGIEERPLAVRLADSIVFNYQLFRKESPDDEELAASLAQAYLMQADVYRIGYSRWVIRGNAWYWEQTHPTNESLIAAQAGCNILRQLVSSNSAKHDAYAEELANGLKSVSEYCVDPHEQEAAISEAINLREELAKNGSSAPIKSLSELLIYSSTIGDDSALKTKRLERGIDLLKGLVKRPDALSEDSTELAQAYVESAKIKKDDLSARLASLQSAVNVLTDQKVGTPRVDPDVSTSQLRITAQRELADALNAAGRRDEAIQWANRAAATGEEIVKTQPGWISSLVLRHSLILG